MRALAAVAVSVLVAACQAPPPEMTETEREAIVAEVEAWWLDMEEAWESLDVDRVMALNVQTPAHTFAGSGVITRGVEAVDEMSRAYISSIAAVDWTQTDKHIAVLSRDAVAMLDVGTVVETNSEGVTSEAPYTYTYVLVRQNGEWRMLLWAGS